MVGASRIFTGMKDLRSFTDDDPTDKSTIVKIQGIEMAEHADLILVRIVGSHFIWKLVRRIVGVLVEVGRGALSNDQVMEFVKNKSNTPSRFTAPPSGLFLEKVYFKREDTSRRLHPPFSLGSAPDEFDDANT